MAISWGGYNGHLRVGIDHVISPANPAHSDTTVDVTWKYYVDSDGWNFADPETLQEGADGWGGTSASFFNSSSGNSILVDTHKETYNISYSSGSKSANANLTGAYNGASPSHSVTVNLPDRPVATPSAGESPVISSITSTSFVMTWGFVTDNGGATVDKYEVQVDNSSNFASPVYDNTNVTGTGPLTISGLSSNTTYYMRMRAHNSAGWGDWTNNYTIQTQAGGPSAPGTPLMTSRTSTQIAVSWSAASANGGGAVTYEIQCSTVNTFATTVSDVSGLTVTNRTVTGLTAGTTYYFRVRATNSAGTSGWSGTLTQPTLAAPSTYNDSGDFVTLVGNGFGAVADKLVHLGMFIWRGKTTALTVNSSVDSAVNMNGAQIGIRGPDAPTYTGTGTTDFTINYSGTYEIEYAFRANETGTTRWGQMIYINGNYMPSSTQQKGGIWMGWQNYNANATSPVRVVKITRRLDVGDTIGFGVWQNSGAAWTQPTPGASSGDLYAWARVTMVGF